MSFNQNFELVDFSDSSLMALELSDDSPKIESNICLMRYQSTPSIKRSNTFIFNTRHTVMDNKQEEIIFDEPMMTYYCKQSSILQETPKLRACSFDLKHQKCPGIEALEVVRLMSQMYGMSEDLERSYKSLFSSGISIDTPVLQTIENQYIPSKLILIDCRWEYEYNGGSVKTAININNGRVLKEQFLLGRKPDEQTMVIFFCEFSQVRARKLSNYFRSMDVHLHGVPWFPETYLMKGGFNNFFKQCCAFTTGCYIQEQERFYDKKRLEYSDNGRYFMNIPAEDQIYL
ncbi:Rhodanese-like_domain-containing protein [Hexamita inflata]|uniref:protein-tyrosine-phosphatase n=1 Tax=Hexamita inflata TaxID=28002 RepID=A0AA86Q5H0_9EUKA|nr:Rhodanese-like domain-containing protein [Hexamita inflata]